MIGEVDRNAAEAEPGVEGSRRRSFSSDRRPQRTLLVTVVVLALVVRAFLGFAGLSTYLVHVFWLEEPALLLVLALAVVASIHSLLPRRVRPGRSTTRAAVRMGPMEDRR